MSEVAGEAVVVIRQDESQLDYDGAGKRAGQGFAGSFGSVLKRLPAIAGIAAVGASVSKAFTGALQFDAAGAKIQAQLGLTEGQAARAGEVAGDLYADNFGDSLGDTQAAVGSVLSSIKGLRQGTEKEVNAAARAALEYADVFDTEVPQVVQTATGIINSGLAGDAVDAFDLLTAASQRVPQALREDLFAAADEYAKSFDQIGLSGKRTFDVLASASDQGVFGLDKAGDAVKEFTIRSTDLSSASVAAYKTLGLSAQESANDVLAGGDRAAQATQRVIDRLLQIEDPAKQANTAIALFGTPLEDLGTKNIPKFLRSLQGTDDGLGKVAGATERASDTLYDTPLVEMEARFRRVQAAVQDLAIDALPYVLDGMDAVSSVARQALLPVLDAVVPVAESVGQAIGLLFGGDDVRNNASGFAEVIDGALGNTGKYVGPLTSLGVTIQNVVSGIADLVTDVLIPGVQQVAPVLLDVAGQVASALLPVLVTLADTVQTSIIPALTGLWSYLQANILPAVLALADVFVTTVLPALAQFWQYLIGNVYPAVISLVTVIATNLRPVIDALVDVFVTRILPTFQRLVQQITTQLIPALAPLVAKVVTVTGFLLKLASAILGKVLPPLIRLAGFILAKVVPAVVTIITWVARFVNGVLDVGVAIGQGIAAVVRFGANLQQHAVGAIADVVMAVTGLPGKIIGLGGRMLEAGKRLMGKFFSGLAGAAKGVGGLVADIAVAIKDGAFDIINFMIDKINGAIPNELEIPGPNINLPDNPIPHLQRGTQSWTGGLALVGEQGPEYVNLPAGARVYTASQTRALLNDAMDGQQRRPEQVALPEVRDAGGNVYIGTLMPHDYDEFQRQVLQQKRLANVGGRRPVGAVA